MSEKLKMTAREVRTALLSGKLNGETIILTPAGAKKVLSHMLDTPETACCPLSKEIILLLREVAGE